MHLTCVRTPCICIGMDGATNTTVTERLIALDIEDAAEKLYAELLEEAHNDAFGLLGDGDYAAPRVTKAWCRYLDRGADNYPWFEDRREDVLNAEGLRALERFTEAFEQAALG